MESSAESHCTGIVGPAPLLRHGGSPGGVQRLILEPQGLELLRHAVAPVHVVFAVGGSRCGKSTLGNALAFGEKGPGDDCGSFVTGDTFEPVTTGVDMVLRPLEGGGTFVYCDCEGAFHPFGSANSARGFGVLGLVAYFLSSTLMHVSMGTIDERDLEALGFLAARCAEGLFPSGSPPRADPPRLVLLVNGARFPFDEAAANALLRPPAHAGELEAGLSPRSTTRRAIAEGFSGSTVLEGLPQISHPNYWRGLEEIKRGMLKHPPTKLSPSGPHANGSGLAARLRQLVDALNGDTPRSLEPEAAPDHLIRTTCLEPLVDEVAKHFATQSATSPCPEGSFSPTSLVEAGLAEFDRRAGERLGSRARAELLGAARERLGDRLGGLAEAQRRGRKEGKARRPPRSPLDGVEGKENQRPSSQPCRARKVKNWKDEQGQSSPGSPASCRSSSCNSQNGGQRKGGRLVQLEKCCASASHFLERSWDWCQDEFLSIGTSVAAAERAIVRLQEDEFKCSDRDEKEFGAFEARWRDLVGEISNERYRMVEESDQLLSGLSALCEEDFRGRSDWLSEEIPIRVQELRDNLEAERLKKTVAIDSVQEEVDDRMQMAHGALEVESRALQSFRASFERRFTERTLSLRADLDAERRDRKERETALTSLVEGLGLSLQALLCNESVTDTSVADEE
eukprot:gnl/MRDRNA2_/MRDRNA2_95866_c0_seq1.p1 gnl/MRDRNA2_/MRDRNA2_95866_c0~~gnl/MRDRNA2_/MRDRNA2_95866_c0_seq1.p1  ORF type:complete len:681 (+),score=133.88 gnl/MRDRNA2_/MRDRNA2_95866_c0_seq1:52-2094(+)